MAAYAVSELDIPDAEAIERCEAAMAKLVPSAGGRLLARERRRSRATCR